MKEYKTYFKDIFTQAANLFNAELNYFEDVMAFHINVFYFQ